MRDIERRLAKLEEHMRPPAECTCGHRVRLDEQRVRANHGIPFSEPLVCDAHGRVMVFIIDEATWRL